LLLPVSLNLEIDRPQTLTPFGGVVCHNLHLLQSRYLATKIVILLRLAFLPPR
jgi:hypothetical protein